MLEQDENQQGECASAEMPRYQCFKQVWALKITDIKSTATPDEESDGSALLVVEEGFRPIKVDRDYVSKHKPEAGGYYVVYADGYKSYSPAAAFESGYTRI